MESLLAGMSSLEAAQWLASLRLDPEDADRADIRHALMMDQLAHLLGRPKRGRKLPSVSDYLADLPWRKADREADRPRTPAEMRRKMDAVMVMLGGQRRRRQRGG